ncbi:MAG: D-alanine--D-alanine ligase [Rhodospirillales bacterium]|nr:D-alanine--D-alanine ligase [Rhodospirillales bacterium]
MTQNKKTIAVFFGGRSPEHDVSVVTGLQILSAIDGAKYDAFPVYITTDGEWLVGDLLKDRANYMLSPQARKEVQAVTLDLKPAARARLVPLKTGLFGGAKPLEFDVAIPSFHGLFGEDGNIQGLFELAGVPYAGMRTLASSVLMDKGVTKKVLQGAGIPMLPYAMIYRPDSGYMIEEGALKGIMGEVKFPCIVKPSHLGSSIGVAKAKNIEELRASLPGIFEYDDAAIIEPFVENLVEYNVAVSKAFDGTVRCSAIERPKATEELLDFKQKYLSGKDSKTGQKLGGGANDEGGAKIPGAISQGMLSLTRELNPDLKAGQAQNIKDWAMAMFRAVEGTGAPRIDFIGNQKTGELWLNEVNPWPGSIGYFLWEAAPDNPVLFTDLLSALIEEALKENKKRKLHKDPVPVDARLLKRAG